MTCQNSRCDGTDTYGHPSPPSPTTTSQPGPAPHRKQIRPSAPAHRGGVSHARDNGLTTFGSRACCHPPLRALVATP